MLKSILVIMLIIPAVSIAQEKRVIKDGEIKVKVIKDEDGKVSESMKTFNLEDEDQVQEFLKGMGVELNVDSVGSFYHFNTDSEGAKNINININRTETEEGSEEKKVHVYKYQIDLNDDGNSENDKDDKMHDTRVFKYQIDTEEDTEINEELMEKLKGLGNKEVDEIIKLIETEGSDVSIQKKVIVKTIEMDTEDDGKGTMIFIKKESKSEDSNDLPKNILEKFDASSPIQELSLFPNPTSDKVKLSFVSKEKKDYQLSILDAKGSAVYEKSLSRFKGNFSEDVDLSSYENGIYFFKLISEGEQLIKKIVVQ